MSFVSYDKHRDRHMDSVAANVIHYWRLFIRDRLAALHTNCTNT